MTMPLLNSIQLTALDKRTLGALNAKLGPNAETVDRCDERLANVSRSGRGVERAEFASNSAGQLANCFRN